MEGHIRERGVTKRIRVSFEVVRRSRARGHGFGMGITMKGGDEEVLVTSARLHWEAPCQVGARPVRPAKTFRGRSVRKR